MVRAVGPVDAGAAGVEGVDGLVHQGVSQVRGRGQVVGAEEDRPVVLEAAGEVPGAGTAGHAGGGEVAAAAPQVLEHEAHGGVAVAGGWADGRIDGKTERRRD